MLAIAMLALAGIQEATLAAPEQRPDGGQRWSILADPCAPSDPDGEILVCGKDAETSQRLPLPGERGPPDRPIPSNPYLTGAGALAATASPCATLSQGCTTGVDIFGGGTALVRLIGKAIDKDSCCEAPGEATNPVALVGDAISALRKPFRKKVDKSKRVPIPLDDPAPAKAEAAPEPGVAN